MNEEHKMNFMAPLGMMAFMLVVPLWTILLYTQKEVANQQRQINELKRELEEMKKNSQKPIEKGE